MNAQRYARLQEAFFAVRGMPADAQEAALRERLGDDAELVVAARQLVAGDRVEGGLLDAPLLGEAFRLPCAEDLGGDALPSELPRRFGDFEVEAVLGAGGMGIVYRAFQDAPRREVALKVVQPGQASAAQLERFRFEVEALGRLKHPGIATIYAAGTFDLGAGAQPYLAMELVEGDGLLDACVRLGWSHDERVQKLIEVADAVQHAHQRGVIHRDLKPANVLVDAAGQPKVVDFGVAVVQARGAAANGAPAPAEAYGTPRYMSPEQLAGAVGDVDTRADVYALGVLAHELLTGRTPAEVGDAAPALSGELAAVVAAAVAADPDARYESAAAFAADLRRVLAQKPASVSRLGAVGRALLFASRNRVLVAGVASTVAAVLVGLVVTALAWRAAEDARVLAEQRLREATASAQRAASVRAFVLELLARFDPQARGMDAGIEHVLASAGQDLAGRFGGHPDLEADVRVVLGGLLRLFARYPEAEAQVERGLALRRAALGGEDPATLRAQLELVRVQMDQGEHVAALETVEALARACARRDGEPDDLGLQARHLRARCLRLLGRTDEAMALLGDAAPQDLRGPAELALRLEHERALVLWQVGQGQAASERLEALMQRSLAELGAEHPLTVAVTNSLGTLLLTQRRLERAAPLLEKIHAYRVRRFGPEHPETLQSVHNLAGLAAKLDQRDLAEARYVTAYEGRRRALGPSHAATLGSLLSLANQLSGGGELVAAAERFDELLAATPESLPGNEWLPPYARGCRAVNEARRGHFDAAMPELRAGLDALRQIEGDRSARVGELSRVLARLEAALRRAGHPAADGGR